MTRKMPAGHIQWRCYIVSELYIYVYSGPFKVVWGTCEEQSSGVLTSSCSVEEAADANGTCVAVED